MSKNAKGSSTGRLGKLKKRFGLGERSLLRQAERFEKLGDWRQAGSLYEQSAELRQALRCYEKAGDYRLCAEIAEQLAQGEVAAKFYRLAGENRLAIDILEQLGQFEKVAELYAEDGMHLDAAAFWNKAGQHSRAAEIYLRESQFDDAGDSFADAGDIGKAAAAYSRGGHYGKAAALFEDQGDFIKAGEIYEKSGRYFKAGEAYQTSGEMLRAAEAFERQTDALGYDWRLLPDNKRIQLEKVCERAAECYSQEGHIDKAIRVLEKSGQSALAAQAARKGGDFKRAGELFEEAGQLLEAEKMYAEAGDPQTAALLRGEHELSIGNEEAAAVSLVEGGELIRAAELYWKAGRFGDAAGCYEKAGDLPQAAELFGKAGEFEQAMDLYARTGRHFDAAQAASEANSEEKMVEFLQRVTKEDSNYRKAVVKLVECYLRRGWSSLAVEKLVPLIAGKDISVDDLDLWYLEARAQEDQGELQRAAEILHRMMSVQHNFQDVRDRHAKLRERIEEETSRETSFQITHSREISPPALDTDGPRYKIEELIGKGGMGSVYRAYDQLLKRPVAYKVLSEKLARSRGGREKLLEEARAAAALNHPNIITVHDMGIDGDQAFICMELVEGESYSEILRRKRRLDLTEAMHLLVSVCQGLDHAHHRGIVHRDLKPSNLLVTKDKRVKIVDFGIAQPIRRDSESSDESYGGTPKYIAPEQARAESADARTDIYSLGASFYELLVGEPPFVEGNLIYQHLHTPPPSPRSRGVELPPALEELVLHCLAKDPAKRFQSAGEIISFASAARLI